MFLSSVVHIILPLLAYIPSNGVYRKAFYTIMSIACMGLSPGGNTVVPMGVAQTFGMEYFGPIMGGVYMGYVRTKN